MLRHAVAAALALSFIGAAHAGKTLDAIKQRGQLVCGVNPNLQGFSAADSQGNWAGLDVDVCKAIAASVLSDAGKIKWVPLNAQQRFAALQSGEIDILSRNTTWTLTRDASLGLMFTGTTYYDGQGFMPTAIGYGRAASWPARIPRLAWTRCSTRVSTVSSTSRAMSLRSRVMPTRYPRTPGGMSTPCIDSSPAISVSRVAPLPARRRPSANTLAATYPSMLE